jgi:hypothetical protein
MIVLSLSRLRCSKEQQGLFKRDLGKIEMNAQAYIRGRSQFVVSPEFPFPLHLFSLRLSAMLIKR